MIKKFYTDFEKSQEDVQEGIRMGIDVSWQYDPNEKGWSVTFRTLEAIVRVI